jgi:hypothetical protein
MPAIGTFDNPPSRLAANTTDQRRLTSATDVRFHSAFACLLLGIIVVVPFVEADVLGQYRPEHSPNRNRIKRGTYHPLVVDIGAGQGDCQWNPATVGQNVAFRAEFCTIGRIWPRDIPPFGAFTEALSSEAHSRSSPTFSW